MFYFEDFCNTANLLNCYTVKDHGGVAQLGERLPCTQEVIGSIPFTSTSLRCEAKKAVRRSLGEGGLN